MNGPESLARTRARCQPDLVSPSSVRRTDRQTDRCCFNNEVEASRVVVPQLPASSQGPGLGTRSQLRQARPLEALCRIVARLQALGIRRKKGRPPRFPRTRPRPAVPSPLTLALPLPPNPRRKRWLLSTGSSPHPPSCPDRTVPYGWSRRDSVACCRCPVKKLRTAMEGTNLQTPDDALSYIAPIGELVPYTCHVTASHPTIRTRVRSLQRRWLLLCLSEIGQTLLLFSCCPRVVSPHLTSHQPPTARCQSWYRQSTARRVLTLAHGLKRPSLTPAVKSHRRPDAQICLHRLLPMLLASRTAPQGMASQVYAAFE